MSPVGVKTDVDGRIVVEWHAPPIPGPDYETLCCLDANDPVTGTHGVVKPKPRQKITCSHCRRIWSGVLALNLCATDFAREAIR